MRENSVAINVPQLISGSVLLDLCQEDWSWTAPQPAAVCLGVHEAGAKLHDFLKNVVQYAICIIVMIMMI